MDSTNLTITELMPSFPLKVEHLIAAMEDGICLQSLNKKILQANDSFAKLLDLKKEDLLGKSCQEIFSLFKPGQNLICDKLHSIISDFDSKIDSTNNLNTVEETITYNISQRLRIRISPVQDSENKLIGYLVVIRDVTNVIQQERELARAEQLALIGELTAGLAHEIRNPLAGIQGAMDILLTRSNIPESDKEILTNARKEVSRIDLSIRNLLERSRLTAMRIVPASIAETASQAVLLAKEQIAAKMNGNNINLSYTAPSNPMIIPIDTRKIEAAILNLILNALEAIDQKTGQIQVRLYKNKSQKSNPEVVIEVEDNGRGISPENLNKIFNPFFSTKSNGTGLGLAAVRRILRAHNGRVEVQSKLGKGSVFRLYLPYRK
jgi:two-component system, NtrC family, sensor histidine kinase AtoS